MAGVNRRRVVRRGALIACALLAIAWPAPTAVAQPAPPALTAPVNDFAQVISALRK